jgi:tripartite-type tricarboxylate transporter receptor subunit TctC
MKILRFLGFILLAVPGVASAQTYPTKTIVMIVPFAPGGGVDTMARLIAAPLGQRLGQPIIVENRAGAGGNIGTEMAAKARPDGYTLLMGSLTPNSVSIHLYSRLGFDPIKDFEPIAYVSTVPNILVVTADSPIRSAKDLVDRARAEPGRLTYGSAGVGSSQHLAAAILSKATGTELMHIPYKGAGPALADLLAGHLSFMLDTTGPISFVQAGKMRGLATAAKNRSTALPSVPTFDELGIPGVYSSAWYGVMAPAGTPREIVNRVNAEVNAVLREPEMKKRLIDFGADIGGGTPEDFAKLLASEIVRYGEIVKASGAKLD